MDRPQLWRFAFKFDFERKGGGCATFKNQPKNYQQKKIYSTDIWHGSCFSDVYKELWKNGSRNAETAISRQIFFSFPLNWHFRIIWDQLIFFLKKDTLIIALIFGWIVKYLNILVSTGSKMFKIQKWQKNSAADGGFKEFSRSFFTVL